MNIDQNQSKRSVTRTLILTTGRTIILGKGFTAVGLNEILTKTGVPKGSFYHYFKSKEEFGNALLEDYFEQYLAYIDELFKHTVPNQVDQTRQKLINYFSSWLKSQSSNETHEKCLVVKLSGEVTDLSESMRLTLKTGTENVIQKISECIAYGVSSAEFKASLDPIKQAQELYHLWIGATILTKVSRNAVALENAMNSTLEKLDYFKNTHG